jgi:phytanoyl-CoA hydroxylase
VHVRGDVERGPRPWLRGLDFRPAVDSALANAAMPAHHGLLNRRLASTKGEKPIRPFQQYAAEGYYVARDALPRRLVEALASAYREDAKTTREPLLRQNGREEINAFDANGYVTVPLVNCHLTKKPGLRRFQNAILDLACSAEMLGALREITLESQHVLEQIMIFEQAATAPHQDWVYLDSFPPGRMTAAWVALEDIDPAATRFFIVPGSQDFDRPFPREWVFNSTRYMHAMREILDREYADQIVTPEMRAGDVLFWNSRTIHGSLPGADQTKSRLSLTAHYLPHGYGFGNHFERLPHLSD